MPGKPPAGEMAVEPGPPVPGQVAEGEIESLGMGQLGT